MAEAPSFSTSTRWTAASGMLLTSTEVLSVIVPPPETRLPLISTSVRCDPGRATRRSTHRRVDAPEPLAATTFVLPWTATLTVWRNCSAVVAPVFWICSCVMTCTGSAPSSVRADVRAGDDDGLDALVGLLLCRGRQGSCGGDGAQEERATDRFHDLMVAIHRCLPNVVGSVSLHGASWGAGA